MILKEILCWVRQGQRQAFSQAQEAWLPLLQAEGFLGQLGGWCEQDPQLAILLGVWRDDSCYQAFMAADGLHDQIVAASSQLETIERCEVLLHRLRAGAIAQHLRPENYQRTFSWLSPKPGHPRRSMKLQQAWFLRVRESPLPLFS